MNGRYPIETADDALAIINGPLADLDRIALLYDTFHLASNGVDVISCVHSSIGDIGHVQLADTPGRGEPGTGQLDFAQIMDTLSCAGYQGTVACEYKPTGDTLNSLAWLAK